MWIYVDVAKYVAHTVSMVRKFFKLLSKRHALQMFENKKVL